MADTEVGRAICPGTPTSSSPPTEFSAGIEPTSGQLASAIADLHIKDLRVISSAGEKMLYSRDQSEIPRMLKDILFRAEPDAVVQPLSTEALSTVVRYAASKGATIIPRGAGSSPFGGSVPVMGGLVVDMSRMDGVLGLDVEKATVSVQGGARWADIDHFLEKSGFSLSTCPSSKFSTVGGWIATGGLGLNSYSRGHLSRSVVSVDLVTADGNVRTLSAKNPEFASVFGSEGQLGVIASARLYVMKKPAKSRPHMLLFDDVESALSFAKSLSDSDVGPAHIMFESANKFSLINRMLGHDYFRNGEAVIVSIEGDVPEAKFQSFVKAVGLKEEKEFLARYMWNERFFPMKIRKFGPGMLGTEVLMPVSRLADGLNQARSMSKKLGVDPLFEVHFLEGGWALLLCFYMTDQGNTIGYMLDAVKSMILSRLLIDLGAKPYSIGVWNNPFSSAEGRDKIAKLRKAKSALDPRGVMNSGKMFSLSGRFGRIVSFGFGPRVMMPGLKAFLVFSPITARVMAAGHRFANKRLKPKSRSELLRIADECAMCGACVSVCPAYVVASDERVTARGKLLTVKAMARGQQISKEHAHRIFLCMRCKACEQVCQSKLELISVFDALEKELEELYGKDQQEIEKFIKYAESTPLYDKLVERGLVLGAPRHGMGGGEANV